MKREELCRAVKYIAIGYIFLHFNFNIGTFNLFPDFIGYVMFVLALPTVAEYEDSAWLLKPLGILLGISEAVGGVFFLFGAQFDYYLLTAVFAGLELYFHFQLLTNLAEIALKFDCYEKERILQLRTARTVLTTVLFLPIPWDRYEWLTIGVLITHLVVIIWICIVLFGLRNSLMIMKMPEDE